MVKKFKHRFYIKELLIWICKTHYERWPYKYKYSVYGIGFNSRSEFSSTDKTMGKMPLFLELRWPRLCTLIIKIKIS